MEWLMDDNNTYVVQCGDQVDTDKFITFSPDDEAKRDINLHKHYYAMIFMEYMNVVSRGHVISLIGNHEWMNVDKAPQPSCIPFWPCQNNFKFGLPLGIILRRRNFIVKINSCVFSHAGICDRHINEYMYYTQKKHLTLTEFIDGINHQATVEGNYGSRKTVIFANIIIGESDRQGGFSGIIWNRDYRYPIEKNREGTQNRIHGF